MKFGEYEDYGVGKNRLNCRRLGLRLGVRVGARL